MADTQMEIEKQKWVDEHYWPLCPNCRNRVVEEGYRLDLAGYEDMAFCDKLCACDWLHDNIDKFGYECEVKPL